jgi:hypothetical protein
MVLLKLSPIMGCLVKYLLLLCTMAGLYSLKSIRFYDLSLLARFCFFKNLLSVLEQLIYDLAFKLTTPC